VRRGWCELRAAPVRGAHPAFGDRERRDDGREFLAWAGRHRLRVATTVYPFTAAATAVADLAADRVNGSDVPRMD
jgi:hypothetical protein